ncbi:hypothetical protein CTM78_05225 [Fusobacterium pseudoperiodonticum]|nr:hypothetical protein CTM78_05225 [Fusobacterium pseudoperiodonticum]
MRVNSKIKIFIHKVIENDLIMSGIVRAIDVEVYLKRLIIKNKRIVNRKLIEGINLKETNNYYDNIIKIEL